MMVSGDGGVLSSRKEHPQFAVNVAAGANIPGMAMNITRGVAPTHVQAVIDVKNAFNMVQRPLLFEALSKFRYILKTRAKRI